MAVYKVLEDGNELLRKQAKSVPMINKNIIKLLDNMADTLHEYKGLGLAAPQIGISKRVVVIDLGDDTGVVELINPELLESAGEEVVMEGCLSIPGIFEDVARAATVTVKYTDRHGVEQEMHADGMMARVVQHEIDHLNGILFTDYESVIVDPNNRSIKKV